MAGDEGEERLHTSEDDNREADVNLQLRKPRTVSPRKFIGVSCKLLKKTAPMFCGAEVYQLKQKTMFVRTWYLHNLVQADIDLFPKGKFFKQGPSEDGLESSSTETAIETPTNTATPTATPTETPEPYTPLWEASQDVIPDELVGPLQRSKR